MTDDKKKRGLTNRRNLAQEDFEDDFEVDVRSERNGYLSERPASVTDLRRGLDAAGVRSGDVAEVWVSPDGDDHNPGTRSAPLASIRAAVNALKGKYKLSVKKVVNVLPTGDDDEYVIDEPIIINEPHFIVRADSPNSQTRIKPGSNSPVFWVTALTYEDADNFLEQGGPSFNFTFDLGDLSHNYDYTGVVTDRTNFSTVDHLVEGVKIEGFEFDSADSPIEDYAMINFVSVPNDDGSSNVRNCDVSGCNFPRALDYHVLMKNVSQIFFSFCMSNFGPTIIDNSQFISFEGGSKKGSRGAILPRTGILGVYRTDDSEDTRLGETAYSVRRISPAWQIFALFTERDTTNSGSSRFFDQAHATLVSPLREIILSGDGAFGRDDRNVSLGNQQIGLGAPLLLEDSVSMNAVGGTVYDIQMESSGDIVLRGTKIQNNLTIEGGTTTLKNVTIEGNLTQSGDADIDFTQVTVLGNVDLADDAGEVTWRGGSYYGELTDPSNKLEGAAPGDYLNIS